MLIVYTGNGKGKTTASLGAALRAIGRGKKVLMIQFIKGPWESGEDISVKYLSGKILNQGGIVFKKMGLGFVGILGDKLPFEDHVKAAEEALAYAKKEFDNFDMVVLDEVNVAVSLKLLKSKDVLSLIKDLPDEKIVIFTGRDAPQEFIDAADLATEMKEIKHPYNDGKMGKINVEF